MKKSGAPVATPRVHALRAVPFLKDGTDTLVLSDRQREALAGIGTRLRLPPRMVIYQEHSPARWVFAVLEGAVKSYRDLRSGRRAVSAFLFPQDLFGLAEAGRFVNTTQALTQVTLYRAPIEPLTDLLIQDGELQFKFLAKVTHELREAQRRAIVISRRDAVGRLAMFLSLMRAHPPRAGVVDREVALPMSRTDIAAFLGLSLESVSRAAAILERRGIVKFENRELARILDPARLARLANAV